MSQVVRFTEQEARHKIGQRVLASDSFFQIPFESTGQVVAMHQHSPGQFHVVIQWDKPFQGKIITSQFGKGPYEQHLKEI